MLSLERRLKQHLGRRRLPALPLLQQAAWENDTSLSLVNAMVWEGKAVQRTSVLNTAVFFMLNKCAIKYLKLWSTYSIPNLFCGEFFVSS